MTVQVAREQRTALQTVSYQAAVRAAVVLDTDGQANFIPRAQKVHATVPAHHASLFIRMIPAGVRQHCAPSPHPNLQERGWRGGETAQTSNCCFSTPTKCSSRAAYATTTPLGSSDAKRFDICCHFNDLQHTLCMPQPHPLASLMTDQQAHAACSI